MVIRTYQAEGGGMVCLSWELNPWMALVLGRGPGAIQKSRIRNSPLLSLIIISVHCIQ